MMLHQHYIHVFKVYGKHRFRETSLKFISSKIMHQKPVIIDTQRYPRSIIILTHLVVRLNWYSTSGRGFIWTSEK